MPCCQDGSNAGRRWWSDHVIQKEFIYGFFSDFVLAGTGWTKITGYKGEERLMVAFDGRAVEFCPFRQEFIHVVFFVFAL